MSTIPKMPENWDAYNDRPANAKPRAGEYPESHDIAGWATRAAELELERNALAAQLEEARVLAHDVLAGEIDDSTKQRAKDLLTKARA